MSNPNPGCAADRSLLFGLLALQMGFVTRDSLLQALQTWAADKSRSVRDVFVQQRSMPPGPATLIDDLVHAQFAQHQHRPPKWLRDLSVLVIVRKDLAGIDDPEIRATLAAVPVEQGSDASADAPADDPYATAPSPIPTAPAHGSGVATDGGRRFRILRPHARGGLGEVYLARDDELGREVALKEIQARHADSPENRTRFVREAEITGGLEHPGIVPVYGLGRHEDGRPFYAMRFIRGNSLKDAVDGLEKDEGARRDAGLREVALRKLVRRIYDVCNALEYAHSRGVVHRDLKPGNIMLGNYGETLVVDWGLAKAGAASPTSTAASEAPLQPASAYDDAATRTGDAIGTPAYMAPEQAAGRLDLLGPRSDVYGLGATLYCVLTGRPPFIDREIHLLLDKVQRGDFARPRAVRPELHPALEAICLKAMALRLEDRYASAAELGTDIERWLDNQPVSAWPEPWTIRLRRWLNEHRTIVTAGAVATAGVLALLVWRTTELSWVNENLRRANVAEQKATTVAKREATEASRQKDLAERARDRAERTSYRAQIAHANVLREAGNARLASSVLSATSWYMRGWEYGYLRRQVDPWLTLKDHPGGVVSVQFSPDGSTIVSASGDGTMTIWDARDGSELRAWKSPSAAWAVAVRPDGMRIANASVAHVALSDTQTGTHLAKFRVHETPGGSGPVGNVRGLAYSPDGTFLATAGDDHTARIWQADSATQLHILQGHDFPVNSVEFSPEGTRLATAAVDGSVRLWDAVRGKQIAMFRGLAVSGVVLYIDAAGRQRTRDVKTGKDVSSWSNLIGKGPGIGFSPDGSRLVAAFAGMIKVWDTSSGRDLLTIKENGSDTGVIKFSPDGRRIATASGDVVKLRDARNGKELRAFRGHEGRVRELAFSPDGARLASAGEDRMVAVWDARVIADSLADSLPQKRIQAFCFSPDGARLAVAESPRRLSIRDTESGALLQATEHRPLGVTSLRFSADGSFIAGTEGGRFVGWDAKTLAEVLPVRGDWQHADDLGHDPTGPLLATKTTNWDESTRSSQTTVRIWDGRDAELVNIETGLDRPSAVHFSPDGKYLVSLSSVNVVTLWETRLRTELATLAGHTLAVHSVRFAPDGSMVATGSADKTIKLWSLPAGKEIATLRGHGAGISDIDFNPDVTRLVSCSRTDGTIKLWDVVDGEEILTLTGDVFPERVCFTPDGKQLACRGGSRLTFRDGNFENELPRLVHGAPLSDLTVQPADALVTARDINGQTVTWDLRPGGDLISRPGSFELRRQGNGVRIVARTPYAPGFSLWPEDHSRRARAAATWHAEQARAAEQQQDWYGAAFHVSQLARHQFWDHALHHRAADLWLRAAQPRKAALHHAWQAWQTTNSADHSR